MIRMRKEGEEYRRGFNLMIRPHRQVIFMWGTYQHRIVIGIGYSKISGFHFHFSRWNKDYDIEMSIKRGILITMETALDGGYKE